MENTLQRIKKFIDFKGIAVRVFEQNVGMSNGSFASQLKNDKTIGVDKLENILHAYPELSAEWTLTGNGEMLKYDTYNNVAERPKNLIPFYDDVMSFGGINEYSSNMEGIAEPTGHIDAGDWFTQATSAVRHYGDSMVEYPSGCILALKDVQDINLIVWGKNYMIETTEYRITKCLQKGSSRDYVCAYSSNKETYPDGRLKHEPIDIPKESIRKLSLVLGCVIKHSSSKVVPISSKKP